MGVALVASAARQLTASTCKLRVTMVINAVAAVITFYYPATYMFPACILAGGLVTLYTNRKQVMPQVSCFALAGVSCLSLHQSCMWRK